MKSTELRQLIRESINEYIRDIDEAGNVAALEAKMNKTQEAIELREKKMNMDGLDEAYHDMLDKGKMKELGSEVKALKKSLAKYEKQLDKLKSKGEKKEKPELEEKEIVDEVEIDETFPESGSQLEENMDNEAYYEIVQQMKNNGANYDSVVAKLEDMGLDNRSAEIIALNALKDEDMDIYEILSLQKRAGIISETEYKVKVEEAKKMTATQKKKKEDIVKGMKKSKSFGKSKDEKSKMYATATKLATKN
jgi:hypothetical protein